MILIFAAATMRYVARGAERCGMPRYALMRRAADMR